ncbi:MAG: MFS transporter [Candidatus Wallbacteria bacterium]
MEKNTAIFERGSVNSGNFWALIVTQFLNAFNDNAFKTLISLFLIAKLMSSGGGAGYVALGTAVFVVPFIIFSTHCGYFCDKYSKRSIMIIVKIFEIFLMAFGLAAFYYENLFMIFTSLFFMGVHSTLFSPAKYGILPEILKDEEISSGNGIIELTTFVAIIFGTIAAPILFTSFHQSLFFLQPAFPPGNFIIFSFDDFSRIYMSSFFFLAISIFGFFTSLFVAKVPPAGVRSAFKLNFLSDVYGELKIIKTNTALILTLIAISYFWFLGTAAQNNILIYSKEMMGVSENTVGLLLTVLAFGIGVGSGFAGRISGEVIEFGLVPLGACGMTIFFADLYFSYHSIVRTSADLFLIGFSGGLFIVPLNAYLQICAPNGETGRIVGLTNFTANIFMVISAAMIFTLHDYFKFSSAAIFMIISAATVFTTGLIIKILPDFLVRFIFFMVTNLFYKIKITGARRLPHKGAAVIVANHSALIDGFIINATTHRHVIFLIHSSYYEYLWLRWFLKLIKAVKIESHDLNESETAAVKMNLDSGRLVCVFPEFEISPDGAVNDFKIDMSKFSCSSGKLEFIPAFVDGTFGSIFSRAGGRWKLSIPFIMPRKVTLKFGESIFFEGSDRPDSDKIKKAIIDLKLETDNGKK